MHTCLGIHAMHTQSMKISCMQNITLYQIVGQLTFTDDTDVVGMVTVVKSDISKFVTIK